MTDTEIRVLDKGFDFAPSQNKINQLELRTDFEDFCRRMRINWHFRNEPSPTFSEIPSLTLKSSWKPPRGHPNLEVSKTLIENEIFKTYEKPLGYSNLSRGKCEAVIR